MEHITKCSINISKMYLDSESEVYTDTCDSICPLEIPMSF